MKILVKEVETEGLEALIGKRITIFCGVYIYTGDLVGVNESCVKLENAAIVYETGELGTKTWKDAQSLPNSWYVSRGAIESFGIMK